MTSRQMTTRINKNREAITDLKDRRDATLDKLGEMRINKRIQGLNKENKALIEARLARHQANVNRSF